MTKPNALPDTQDERVSRGRGRPVEKPMPTRYRTPRRISPRRSCRGRRKKNGGISTRTKSSLAPSPIY